MSNNQWPKISLSVDFIVIYAGIISRFSIFFLSFKSSRSNRQIYVILMFKREEFWCLKVKYVTSLSHHNAPIAWKLRESHHGMDNEWTCFHEEVLAHFEKRPKIVPHLWVKTQSPPSVFTWSINSLTHICNIGTLLVLHKNFAKFLTLILFIIYVWNV